MLPIKHTSQLYLDIISKRLTEFSIADLKRIFKNKYSQSTYGTFPPKHSCDGKCKKEKNSRGYTIYFCRISRGRYRVIQNNICPR